MGLSFEWGLGEWMHYGGRMKLYLRTKIIIQLLSARNTKKRICLASSKRSTAGMMVLRPRTGERSVPVLRTEGGPATDSR